MHLWSDRWDVSYRNFQTDSIEACQTWCWRFAPTKCDLFVFRPSDGTCWMKDDTGLAHLRSDVTHSGTVQCLTQDAVDPQELSPFTNAEWVMTTNGNPGWRPDGVTLVTHISILSLN